MTEPQTTPYKPLERIANTQTGSKVAYSYKPTPKEVAAVFSGDIARCGGCNSIIGEFKKADGKIQCKKNDCKVMNIVRK